MSGVTLVTRDKVANGQGARKEETGHCDRE